MNLPVKYLKKFFSISHDIHCVSNFSLNMKKNIRVILSICFLLYSLSTLANITDSLFLIKDRDDRLMMIEYKFNLYDIRSKEALQFKNEILQRGNASEQLIIAWMWEDRQVSPGNIDSNIAIFDRYLPAVKKTGDPNLMAILYSVKANALLYARRYSRAFENYLYAYENLKKDPQEKYFNQSWLMYNIAINFYMFRDYNKTIELSNGVAKMPPPISYSIDWFNCINYDLMAMAYLKTSRYDSAMYWLNRTRESAVKSNDSAWIGIAEGNMGLVHYEQEQYDKAVPYFQRGIAYCTKAQIWDNVVPFSTSLAHIYILKGDRAAAEDLLAQARLANEKHFKADNQLLYYHIAGLYEKQSGNYTRAFQLMDSVRFYEKKSNADFETSKRALAESRVAFERQLMDNALLQEKAKSERLRLIGMAVILSLLIIAFVLFGKRQKLRYSLQQKILQNEKLQAEKELSVALFEIKEFTHNITQKNKAIENLLVQVQHLKEQHREISREEVEAIEVDMKQSAMLTEEGWADFNKMFEKAFPGTIAKFKEKLPELADEERRYLKLLKLELSNTEIAGMFGTDEAGIAVLRDNLVKKLDLTGEDEIEILLESL